MAPDDATAQPTQAPEVQHLVVMGVSGSGKTTLATNLSERLGWPVAEADTFHPPENIAKMSAGTPLTDDDRWPWLETIRDWLTTQAQAGRSTIVTCSALRRAYRDVLVDSEGRVRFLHVTADAEIIGERLSRRSGHFMPPTLLPSQLSTLEPLTDDEDGTTLLVDVPPEVVVDRALDALGLTTVR